MSNDPNHPSNQPGGGFTPVKGYHPPAGTQAEQIAKQQEHDRQQQQAQHHKAMMSTGGGGGSGGSGCLIFIVAGVGILSLSVAVTLSEFSV